MDSHLEEEEEEDSQREVQVDSEVDEEEVKKELSERLLHCLVRRGIKNYQLSEGEAWFCTCILYCYYFFPLIQELWEVCLRLFSEIPLKSAMALHIESFVALPPERLCYLIP